MSDVRSDTSKKLIAMIREMREAVLAGSSMGVLEYAGSTPDGTDIGETLRFVFRRAGLTDEKLACFVTCCIGEWINREGENPRLQRIVR